MAELFLSAILSVLFEKLTSPELLKFATQEGIRSKLKRWEKTLKMIKALLNDAEQKQLEDEAVKMWLEELQDLAYDAEDILDEYAAEVLRRELKIEEHQASTSRAQKLIPACCVSCTPTALWTDFSMRSKINDITSRLQGLCKQRTELGLVEIVGGRSTASQQRLPTTCLSTETVVYGREDDKAKILEMVLTNESGVANFDVIPIVGMGGIGKTTLAQQVYNDEKVEDFYPKAWVCVSDDFDILRISKAILEVITFSSCDMKELGAVQCQLKEALNGKRFLIVLDDVWSRDNDLWEQLKAPFLAGAHGSKVIVTTRSSEVALAMRQRKCYNLKILSNDDCWAMFVMRAFNNGETIAHWKLDIIREKVVQKCKGLPLAIKTLGGLLYYKETEDEWMNILNSKIWDLDGKILPVLRLSYYHLPSDLKRCFAYCSILPKDYEFEEKELVLLWMAEGLIQQSNNYESNNDLQLEDLGGQYFHNLLSRSIFQKSSSKTSRYIMHDLVNDLAQMVSRKISFRLEDESESNNRLKLFERTRYASYICHQFDGKRKFEVFNDVKHYLRTHLSVLPINNWWRNCYISNQVVSNLLSRFKRLRVLSLQYYYITKLPDSIGGLRLLRYLNLSFSSIRSLPESINSLCNLQTLLLRDCKTLLKLPDNMGNLINLRQLDILGASLIEEMPLGVRKWQCLRNLSNFVVGKSSGANLKDLEDLKSLCGELHISRLENVINFQDTKKVILSDKKDLKVLLLEWEPRLDESQVEEVESQDVKVLDMLQPHKNLEKLIIRCYRGRKFSSWVGGGSSLESKITNLELVDCKSCTSLPSFGLLGSLKILTIEGMKRIKSIGSEFYGERYGKPFQSLETLCFKDLEEWESWDPIKENDSFPKLQELSIVNCPKLFERLPNNLSSLKKLEIHKCQHLVVSLSNIPRLCKLELDECKKIVCTSSAYSESLESMTLSNISDFGDWPMQEFKKLKSLKMKGCKEVIELWQNEIFMEKPQYGLHNFISLKELVIKDCDVQLTTLLEGIKQKNTLVEEMSIARCNSINFIFKGQVLQSLKKLCIENCEKLKSVLDDTEDSCISSSSSPTFAPHLEKINTHTCHLEHLSLGGCPSLTCLPSIHQLSAALTILSISSCSNLTTIHQLSAALTSLSISSCSNLTTLSLTGPLHVTLKHLEIFECPKLTTLSPKCHLPETLETLNIQYCGKLESIVDRFHDNNTLYEIFIDGCDELKSLPEGLDTLTKLRRIQMFYCGGFTSFPKGGFPSNNIRVCLWKCSKVEALPSRIHTLSSLQIYDCPNISLSEEGLPTKLTKLSIDRHKQYKALIERGFHNFTSLEYLCIKGGSDGECSQEEDMTFTLPSTLTQLEIRQFQTLKNLSFKEFQDLPSLKTLKIADCPKLTSLPRLPSSLKFFSISDGPKLTSLPSLPSSLESLYIGKCPLLKEACKKDKGKEWSKIADIPCVYIDGKFIYDLEEEESKEIKD